MPRDFRAACGRSSGDRAARGARLRGTRPCAGGGSRRGLTIPWGWNHRPSGKPNSPGMRQLATTKRSDHEPDMTMTLVPKTSNAGLRSLAVTAWQDIIGGLWKTELWGRLGWLDVKRRYRRTLLGPFWTSISLCMYVMGVGLVGAGLWHQNITDYLPFLVSGMVAWLLVSTIINEACTLLVSGHALFRNVTFEYSILAYALVWRNLITFLH